MIGTWFIVFFCFLVGVCVVTLSSVLMIGTWFIGFFWCVRDLDGIGFVFLPLSSVFMVFDGICVVLPSSFLTIGTFGWFSLLSSVEIGLVGLDLFLDPLKLVG